MDAAAPVPRYTRPLDFTCEGGHGVPAPVVPAGGAFFAEPFAGGAKRWSATERSG